MEIYTTRWDAAAYGGLMVYAPGDPTSVIGDALAPWLPKSCWVDVVSSADKWSAAEGQAALDLLRKLAARGVRRPNLYLIAPFRVVADQLRSVIVNSGVLADLGIPLAERYAWGQTHVGTVHTFQGKEAEAVFFVLGASADQRRGSRAWVGRSPNILNVAVTRAKNAFYILGRHEVWSRTGVFATAAAYLPKVTWPLNTDPQP